MPAENPAENPADPQAQSHKSEHYYMSDHTPTYENGGERLHWEITITEVNTRLLGGWLDLETETPTEHL